MSAFQYCKRIFTSTIDLLFVNAGGLITLFIKVTACGIIYWALEVTEGRTLDHELLKQDIYNHSDTPLVYSASVHECMCHTILWMHKSDHNLRARLATVSNSDMKRTSICGSKTTKYSEFQVSLICYVSIRYQHDAHSRSHRSNR